MSNGLKIKDILKLNIIRCELRCDMGKNFSKELETIDCIYRHAMECDCQVIIKFLKKYYSDFFLLVGSGGSYSVATAVEYFCVQAGIKAKSVTPLEVQQYKMQIKESAVIIFSAGGKNSDSKNIYSFISKLEPKGVLTVCMCLGSPLAKMQKKNNHNYLYEYKMPVYKDGYLAVESLLSSIIIFAKAFSEVTENKFFKSDIKELGLPSLPDIYEVLQKNSIIVLYGGLSQAAVIDLESKFGEAALGNVQLVNFRNFAHGRHFWLSRYATDTSIISFIDNENYELAKKTLELLPKDIPVCKIELQHDGIDGFFEAYGYVLRIVESAGIINGVDPGKPKINEYGKKLYHLNVRSKAIEWLKNIDKDPIARSVYRKMKNSFDNYQKYYELLKKEYNHLTCTSFKGLIFDYDGTLHDKGVDNIVENEIFKIINELMDNGIAVGIATGRGKSVKCELIKVLSARHHSDVVIAYYNGGCIGTLLDEKIPDKKSVVVPNEFCQIINNFNSVREQLSAKINFDGIDDKNPYQLSVMGEISCRDKNLLHEYFNKFKTVKIVESSHSLDVIPLTSCKNNIFDFFEKKGYKKEEFLTVGDFGHLGGNDFELLQGSNCLSVDSVSNSMTSCLNFMPLGVRGLEATLYLLKKITLQNKFGEFKIGSL